MSSSNKWKELGRPVVVLGAVCLIVTALLAVTNQFTAPIIERNAKAKADASRRVVLEAGADFEEVRPVSYTHLPDSDETVRVDMNDGMDNQAMFWKLPTINAFHSIVQMCIRDRSPPLHSDPLASAAPAYPGRYSDPPAECGSC